MAHERHFFASGPPCFSHAVAAAFPLCVVPSTHFALIVFPVTSFFTPFAPSLVALPTSFAASPVASPTSFAPSPTAFPVLPAAFPPSLAASPAALPASFVFSPAFFASSLAESCAQLTVGVPTALSATTRPIVTSPDRIFALLQQLGLCGDSRAVHNRTRPVRGAPLERDWIPRAARSNGSFELPDGGRGSISMRPLSNSWGTWSIDSSWRPRSKRSADFGISDSRTPQTILNGQRSGHRRHRRQRESRLVRAR